MSEVRPIFIIGSSRSGTSIVTGALREAVGIPGFHEGHYLTMIHGFVNHATESFLDRKKKDPSSGVTMAHLSIDMLVQDIMQMMKARQEALFPGQKVWLDKTPDGLMARAIPYLIKMWPEARFVFTKRRGLENLVSRIKKFSHLSFERQCEHWAATMKVWMKEREKIPVNQRIEIEQREIGLHPGKVAEDLGTFLGLSEKEIKNMEHFFTTERYEFSGGNEKVTKSITELGWDEAQINDFHRICGEINALYGYSEDSNYYLSA